MTLTYLDPTAIHGPTPSVFKFPDPTWEKRPDGRDHCSYCGSLSPEAALELLSDPATSASGADWKYGWPHKIYITSPTKEHLKFYTEHLRGMSVDDHRAFNKVCAPRLGIAFWTNAEGRIGYSAVAPGWQTWTDGGPVVPSDFVTILTERGHA